MQDDFTMVVHIADPKVPYLNIYPIGDLHVGSAQFNEPLFLLWREMVINDPYGKVVIVGDMFDNATKNSKSNVYQARMSPSEQKDYLTEGLRPIKDKIIAMIGGNHERRSSRETDTNILYEVAYRLGIQSLYRERVCFIKITLGKSKKQTDRNIIYVGTLIHGSTRNKNKAWNYTIDGQDFAISGHVHEGTESEPVKIKINSITNTVTLVPFRQIVVNSFLKYGGYGLELQYLPLQTFSFQILRLHNYVKKTTYISDNF